MAGGTVTINIIGDASRLRSALGQSEGMLGDFSSKAQAFGQKLTSAGRRMSIGITLPVLSVTKVLFDELKAGEAAAAQTRAVIKSTGGVANVTAVQVDRLSAALMRKSGIDDEIIHNGANLLLTFKQVHNEVGRGNDIFNRATKAALDLSVAGFGDMNSTAKQLGKALADPITGLTALRRAGVNFTQSQKDTIKALVESGDLLSAQKIILAEVESQVGGSAAAYGKTLPGQISKAVESLKNMGAEILGQVMPAFLGLANLALKAAKFFGNLPKPVQMGILAFVGLLAVAGPLTYAIGALSTVLAVVTSTIGLVVIAVGALVAGAVALGIYWDEVWKFVAENPYVLAVLAPLGAILLPIIAIVGIIKLLADNWSAAWAWIKQAATDAYNFIAPVLNFFRDRVQDLVNVLKFLGSAASAAWGAFSTAASYAWAAVQGPLTAIADVINTIVSGAKGAARALSNLGDIGGSLSPLHLLGFAEGGVIPGPKGAAQLVVAHGGETVVPPGMTMASQSAGSSYSVNVTVNAGMGSDPVAIGKAVTEAQDAYFRRIGRNN